MKKVFAIAMAFLMFLATFICSVYPRNIKQIVINEDNRINEDKHIVIRNATTGQVTECNWAGYEVTTDPSSIFTDVLAYWVVPTLKDPPSTYWFSIWVGIGGDPDFDSENLIQAGTAFQKLSDGTVISKAFWENFPDPRQDICDVSPGDIVYVIIFHPPQTPPNEWNIRIEVNGETKLYLDRQVMNNMPLQKVAEWIVESHFPTPFPNFGTVTFTTAKASINGGNSQPMNSFTLHKTEIMHENNIRTTTSEVGSDGQSFSITYLTPYDVNIKAHCNTEGVDISVPITMDGSPTGYNTPHTFTGLTGTHTFTVPNTDPSGHPFKQWSTGSTSTTITVNTGGTYTAYYQAKYTLTITATSGGTTNPAPGTYTYWQGTVVSVTAIPNPGYILDHWELDGAPAGSQNPISITMNTNHNLHAVFKSKYSPGVGGIVIPVDKFALLAPYIGLTSTVTVAAVATVIYVKRVKRRKEKQ